MYYIEVECGELNDPENGNVSVSALVFDSIATYTCHTNYNLTGDATRMCLADATWSGTEPTCIAIRKYQVMLKFVSMST